MSKQTVNIGDQFETKYGLCEVIDYKNCENVFVKFLKTGGITKTNTSDLRRDQVKDWNYPIVENKGFFGQGIYKARIKGKLTEEYSYWQAMLKRCYNEKILSKEPSYRDCEVCSDWLNYQIFAEWVNSQKYRQLGWQLDKDLIDYGNKIYCPDKCVFIPESINKALAITKKSLKGEPIGITMKGGLYLVSINKYGINNYLGSYNTLEEAIKIYQENKLAYLYELGERENCPSFIMEKFETFIKNVYNN